MTEHTLRTFAQAYVDWLDRGAPEGDPFAYRAGLCDALWAYRKQHNLSVEWEDDQFSNLVNKFEARGLDEFYPFGKSDYVSRRRAATMHKCPRRTAFIRELAQ